MQDGYMVHCYLLARLPRIRNPAGGQLKFPGGEIVTRDVTGRKHKHVYSKQLITHNLLQRTQPPPLPARIPDPKRHLIRRRLRSVHPLVFSQTRIHPFHQTLSSLVGFGRRGWFGRRRGEVELFLRSAGMLLGSAVFVVARRSGGFTCPAGRGAGRTRNAMAAGFRV